MLRTFDRDQLLEILNRVMDPEVPVLSVCELGIVRDVEIDATGGVTVTVTPTYSGCPAIQAIEDDIRSALIDAGVREVRVRSVYAPAWSSDWIPDAAKAKLKAYGIAPPSAHSDDGGLVQLLRAVPAVQCPYCDSMNTEVRSVFGSTSCKSVCYCLACLQPFEQFKSI